MQGNRAINEFAEQIFCLQSRLEKDPEEGCSHYMPRLPRHQLPSCWCCARMVLMDDPDFDRLLSARNAELGISGVPA